MKRQWVNFLTKIQDKILELGNDGVDMVCFRGQNDSKWDLSPTLMVKMKQKGFSSEKMSNLEIILYYDFVTNSGSLLKSNITPWEVLFEMRHHGIPTRILDWTESFSTALYFALNGSCKKPCIWILDPFELNKTSYNDKSVPNPLRDLDFDYFEGFIDKTKKPFNDPIAIIAPRTSARLFAQKGLFTLQGLNQTPLNLNPSVNAAVSKFEIPLNCLEDAANFLKLSGINHYSIFTDLDGLAKYLTHIHNLD